MFNYWLWAVPFLKASSKLCWIGSLVRCGLYKAIRSGSLELLGSSFKVARSKLGSFFLLCVRCCCVLSLMECCWRRKHYVGWVNRFWVYWGRLIVANVGLGEVVWLGLFGMGQLEENLGLVIELLKFGGLFKTWPPIKFRILPNLIVWSN